MSVDPRVAEHGTGRATNAARQAAASAPLTSQECAATRRTSPMAPQVEATCRYGCGAGLRALHGVSGERGIEGVDQSGVGHLGESDILGRVGQRDHRRSSRRGGAVRRRPRVGGSALHGRDDASPPAGRGSTPTRSASIANAARWAVRKSTYVAVSAPTNDSWSIWANRLAPQRCVAERLLERRVEGRTSRAASR